MSRMDPLARAKQILNTPLPPTSKPSFGKKALLALLASATLTIATVEYIRHYPNLANFRAKPTPAVSSPEHSMTPSQKVEEKTPTMPASNLPFSSPAPSASSSTSPSNHSSSSTSIDYSKWPVVKDAKGILRVESHLIIMGSLENILKTDDANVKQEIDKIQKPYGTNWKQGRTATVLPIYRGKSPTELSKHINIHDLMLNNWKISTCVVRYDPKNSSTKVRTYNEVDVTDVFPLHIKSNSASQSASQINASLESSVMDSAHVSYDSSQENNRPNEEQHEDNIKEWAGLYNSGRIIMHDERSNPLVYLSNIEAAKEAKSEGLLKRFCYAAMTEQEKDNFMRDYKNLQIQKDALRLGLTDKKTVRDLARNIQEGYVISLRHAARIADKIDTERTAVSSALFSAYGKYAA